MKSWSVHERTRDPTNVGVVMGQANSANCIHAPDSTNDSYGSINTLVGILYLVFIPEVPELSVL